jgi:hypothetical protein
MKLTIHYQALTHALCLSAGLWLALPSHAADWETIITTKTYTLLVDLDTYNEDNGLPFITSNTRYKTTQPFKTKTAQFSYTEKHTTTQFDCQAQTYRSLKTVYYGQDRRIKGQANAQATFQAIPPKSSIAGLASLVCQVHLMVGGGH